MNIRIFGLSSHSHIDGPGDRLTIYFQGCLRHCDGCNNPDSWPLHGGDKWDTEKIKEVIMMTPHLNGVSFSGGEPFLQPVQALELARYAHTLGLTVWCYSGYTFEEIFEWDDSRFELLKEIDILVDGPFEKDKRTRDLLWRTTSNQRLIDVKVSLALSRRPTEKEPGIAKAVKYTDIEVKPRVLTEVKIPQ